MEHRDSVLRQLLEMAAGETLPQWAQVRQALALCSLRAGETLFTQGVVHPFVYAVRSGLFKLCYLDTEGTEWIKSFACEGHFFASIAALVPHGATSFMVCALEAGHLERIDYGVLASLARQHLAWSRALQVLTLQFAARKEQREFELLTLSAEQRYRRFCAQQPQLVPRIPQKDLARHLGVTAVGLNRIAMRVRRSP